MNTAIFHRNALLLLCIDYTHEACIDCAFSGADSVHGLPDYRWLVQPPNLISYFDSVSDPTEAFWGCDQITRKEICEIEQKRCMRSRTTTIKVTYVFLHE